MLDYAEVVGETGFAFHKTRYWISVSAPQSAQGWKLHVSTIPIDAVRLLHAVLPYLRSIGAAFKIARNVGVLEELNAGGMGQTQIGKFITVYPEPSAVREVAERLSFLTAGFRGPAVPTDIRLGDVVFARYGSFVPQVTYDRLGLPHSQMRLPDGTLHDDTYHVPHRMPSGVTSPFVSIYDKDAKRHPRSGSKLFGPGYLIVDVIRGHAKGSTLLAIDLRTRDGVRPVVLKQARQHCMADRLGRDACWRLRRELLVHQSLGDTRGIPAAREYFEINGDGYLVVDYFESSSIEEAVAETLQNRPWARADPQARLRMLGCLLQLIDTVGLMHTRGYVHRDLNNNNVRVSPDGLVAVLDLEMAHRVGSCEPAVGIGTAGFASPQQQAGEAPTFSDDIYSLASIMLVTLTGIDPRRLKAVARQPRLILDLTGDADELKSLAATIARGVEPLPVSRPSLAELKLGVFDAREALRVKPSAAVTRPGGAAVELDQEQLRHLLDRSISGLLHATPCTRDGLWLSLPFGAGDQGTALEDLQLLRSAHSGVAGVVYTLSRCAPFAWDGEVELAERVRHAAGWLVESRKTLDAGLPGLHFGEAGVAVALHVAADAGLVRCQSTARQAIRARLPGDLDWPDLTHGAAGQGLAALVASPDLAAPCAEYLIETQQPDGSWVIPEGIANVSGQKLTGFAHGTAGIVYFLAEFARRDGGDAATAAMLRGMDWLSRLASRQDSGSVTWPYSDKVEKSSRWWCHGAPGIALAYLRAYEATQERRLLTTALEALDGHPVEVRYGNLSYCHGLVGLGEIYLEAFRVTQDPRWLYRSHALLRPIAALAAEASTGTTWLVEDPCVPVADLGLGCSGVTHFLLRLHAGPERVGLPLLPPPIICSCPHKDHTFGAV